MRSESSPWKNWLVSRASKTALICGARKWSWEQIDTAVEQYCQHLINHGVASKQIVVLVGKNQLELVFAYLACLQLNVTPALIPPQSAPLLQKKIDTLYAPNEQVCIWDMNDDLDTDAYQPHWQWVNGDIELGTKKNACLFQSTNPASIIFTSGSSGHPKAVLHLARQHMSSAKGLMHHFSYDTNDVWLLSLPMFHVSGLAIIWRWLAVGAVLKVGCGHLDSDIQGVSHASLVATQLQRILDSTVPLQLKRVLLGGSHIPQALTHEARAHSIDIWLGYGLTEAASTVTAKSIGAAESAGTVLPYRNVKIEQGRIHIAGETLAEGYFHQGKLQSLTNEQGWFDTNDLGQWIEPTLKVRELKVIGRADNLFISGGENIHCEEIEAALLQHEDIQQVTVVPVNCSEFGARPVAVIRAETLPCHDSIHRCLREVLERFKWPIAYYLMPENMASTGIKTSRNDIKIWLKHYQSEHVVIS
ncbi:o-succinylbenzoate--CoA ligase [Vibrio gelatinilyticus]|uniref:o-succinylbenzoate--CoA ligase n=1 Tax=Vibrio gelatinilyticus TaxID=2893468 RepID=UPI00244638C1|nr:o-succinylbenzoate--CoA ligase [Vibrio gelatinilyticus]